MALFQGLERIEGAMLLEEVQPGVHQQHDGDDDEVIPFAHHRRQQRRHLDHPRYRPPKPSEDAMPELFFLFLDFVIAVLHQTLFRLAIAQTPRAVHLETGQGLLNALSSIIIAAFAKLHRPLLRLRQCCP